MLARGIFHKDHEISRVELCTATVTYEGDISVAQDMSAVLHVVTVNRFFRRCMVAGEEVISGDRAGERAVLNITMHRSRFLTHSTDKTVVTNDGKEIAHEKEGECG